ncbi:MAG: response regulator [Candidatus Eisenbacteria sp.]|nr:response regulator [Candidatus Eisenbacteria bacterium]
MSLKLMTVDDSRTIRRIVASYAKAMAPDVEVMEAANGQEALDKCKEKLPDIIILDVNMPVMTGEECLKRLREEEATKGIPVVMLTTESEKQLVVKLLQMGVQQFIIKPFEKEEFMKKVGGVVSKIEVGAPDGGTTSTPQGKYVLVLEDKEKIKNTIAAAAKGVYEMVGTADMGQALAHFKTSAPQLVLANLSIEGVDAFELFVQMRKVPDRQGVRYVGMCLKTANDRISRARGTGYIEILAKPFTPDDVKSVLKSSGKAAVNAEANGDVYVIKAEGGKFQVVIPMILKAIDGAAEDGFMKILIDLSAIPEGDLDDVTLWGGVAEKIAGLGLSASYVSPSTQVIEKLKGLLDTQDLKVLTDADEAMRALAA